MRGLGHDIGRVTGPSGIGPGTREHSGEDQQRGYGLQPEREGVKAGEGQVGSAYLQRHDPIGEARYQWHRSQEDHRGSVQSEELIVVILADEVITRGGELHPYHHRHDAADPKEEQPLNEIQRPDLLVVGAGQPLGDPGGEAGPLKAVGVVAVEDVQHDDAEQHHGDHDQSGEHLERIRIFEWFRTESKRCCLRAVPHVGATGRTVTVD